MHKVRRVFKIKFRFAYSFLLLGIGIGIGVISLFIFFTVRAEKNNELKTAFPEGARFATNQIIIKYKRDQVPSDLSKEEKEKLEKSLSQLGVLSQKKLFTVSDSILETYYILNLPEKTDIPKMYEKLQAIPQIDSITPDYILSVQEIPDDPYFPVMWGLSQIQAEEAWDLKSGKNNVVVAVIDTGVDSSNEDLKGNVLSGINTISNNSNTLDDHGHGTHVAGTVGAITNNNVGVSSISWGARILPVKSCDSTGDCKTSDVARGIQYAADRGAKIANISVAGEGSCRGTYDDVLSYATQKGMLLVIAAGNGIDSRGVDAKNWIPASCKNSFTVAAVGSNGNRASYSNYGSIVSVAAPGGERGTGPCTEETCILSTGMDNTYSLRQGTSMAAPQVSGTAALLLSFNTKLSIDQLKTCLKNGDTISSAEQIGKRLNAQKALTSCKPAVVTPTPKQEIEDVGELSISGIVFIDTNGNKTFDSQEKVLPDAQVLLSGFAQESVLSNSTGRYIFSNLEKGFYTLSLVVNGISSGGIFDVSLQPLFPNIQINLPVSSEDVPKVTAIPVPSKPDNSSVQCVPDLICEKGNGGIQICTFNCK